MVLMYMYLLVLVFTFPHASNAEKLCKEFCNKKPWTETCTWKKSCGACPECSGAADDFRATDTPIDSNQAEATAEDIRLDLNAGPCSSFCKSSDFKLKCTKEDMFCRGCPECSAPRPVGGTTKKAAVKPGCARGCPKMKGDWGRKCTFNLCKTCPECQNSASVQYSICKSHDDCKNNQFCSIQCFTGKCGPPGQAADPVNDYCQPCDRCGNGANSISSDCGKCGSAGNRPNNQPNNRPNNQPNNRPNNQPNNRPNNQPNNQPKPPQKKPAANPKPNIPAAPMKYAFCKAHTDCKKKEFCAVKCFTGDCGGPKFGAGDRNYCQPCSKCLQPKDSVDRMCKACNFDGYCAGDPDCADGHFCKSNNKCAEFEREYCDKNVCGLGDGDCDAFDKVGCAKGLVCGADNCHLFHDIDGNHGFKKDTDCCEVLTTTTKAPLYPTCVTDLDCGTDQFCGLKCWTGRCGKKADHKRDADGKFCQPCRKCTSDLRSASRSCNVCRGKSNTKKKLPPKPINFECQRHSDCAENQFCAVTCMLKDGCGPNKVPKGFPGPYCMPCFKCNKDIASVSRSCNVCLKLVGKKCGRDNHCDHGHYCSSEKVCVKFEGEFCNSHLCGEGDGDCDPDDDVGCATGLVCGKNNCRKYHEPGPATGIPSEGDCCEDPNKAAPKIMFPPCKSHTDCDKKQYCAIKCFTGGCGLESDVPQNTRGLFCQPCKKCEFLGSVTRTCKICKDSDKVVRPDATRLYVPCNSHSHCVKNYFCAIECFEGGCGKDREVPPGTLGKYCQPCDHCKDDFNSITRSCHVCNELKSGKCGSDADCAHGSYCTSKKICVKFDTEYCDTNACGLGDADCDADDTVGCAEGLVCGESNCKKFHTLGDSTGIQSTTDCCKRSPEKLPPAKVLYPTCNGHSDCTKTQFCAVKCLTGKCGAYADVPDGTLGQFCQPCMGCFSRFDSVTRSCDICTEPRPTPPPPEIVYPFCKAHVDCPEKQFCGTQCWTGDCGRRGKAKQGTRGKFCQPCDKCVRRKDSIDRSCEVCVFSTRCPADGDCPVGSYCSSTNICTTSSEDYCENNPCGLGDGDCDENQCIAGLVCGDNNCDKFHEIGVGTGLTPETDCCEASSKLEAQGRLELVTIAVSNVTYANSTGYDAKWFSSPVEAVRTDSAESKTISMLHEIAVVIMGWLTFL